MWDKLGKLAVETGMKYVETRGVDGVMEDVQKVAGYARSGLNSAFSSRQAGGNEDYEYEDEEETFDFDKLESFTAEVIADMTSKFNKSRKHEITSSEFAESINDALSTGYSTINAMIELDPDLSQLSEYTNRIDAVCDDMLMYIGKNCRGSMNTPAGAIAGSAENPFGMQVYSVYPVNFDADMTLLIAFVINGTVRKGETITFSKNVKAEVSFIKMFGKTLDSAEAGDLCAIYLNDNLFDALPDGRFTVGNVHAVAKTTTTAAAATPDTPSSISDNEQEYLEEVKACLADDGIISDRERRLLTKLSKSLGISEERAAELEAMCTRVTLSADEQEYVDEYKACLADDGIVSDRERRLLDKLAKSLGITPDRAKELESM